MEKLPKFLLESLTMRVPIWEVVYHLVARGPLPIWATEYLQATYQMRRLHNLTNRCSSNNNNSSSSTSPPKIKIKCQVAHHALTKEAWERYLIQTTSRPTGRSMHATQAATD